MGKVPARYICFFFTFLPLTWLARTIKTARWKTKMAFIIMAMASFRPRQLFLHITPL